jgi:NAD(P)-dependent dehydrogenase (short-subunit alcohol dehydrogenase family)/predicted flap endonuclease-1-like 5' DNA nuclease
MNLPDLSETTVLVTGATSGVGRDAALRLGQAGARVLVHGRDAERGAETVARIEELGGEASFHRADFADLDDVRALAGEVREATDELDVLCNNAGLFTPHRERSEDGFELMLAVNHLAPFLLTYELADHLAADTRVVTTSSVAHRVGNLDIDMIRRRRGFTGISVQRYADSKLANVLFTRELSRRLGDASANCFHPGNIPGSGFTRAIPFPLSIGADLLESIPLPGVTDSPADGGEALAYLAAAPEIEGLSGEYFDQRENVSPASQGTDEATAAALWELTAEFLGVDPALPEGPATAGADPDRASRGVRIEVEDGDAADAAAAATDTAAAEPTEIEVTDGSDDADATAGAAGSDAVQVEVSELAEDEADAGATHEEEPTDATAEGVSDTADTTAADTEAAGPASLTDISGVGPAKAEALREAGFETVADVRAASQADLTAAAGVGPSLAARIKADVGE